MEDILKYFVNVKVILNFRKKKINIPLKPILMEDILKYFMNVKVILNFRERKDTHPFETDTNGRHSKVFYECESDSKLQEKKKINIPLKPMLRKDILKYFVNVKVILNFRKRKINIPLKPILMEDILKYFVNVKVILNFRKKKR